MRNVSVLVCSIAVFLFAGCSIFKILDPVVNKTISLQVMTYNIYRKNSGDPQPQLWKNRRDEVVAKIKRFTPDVFAVQEAYLDQINYIMGNLQGYAWVGVGRNGGSSGEYVAVFYNNTRFSAVASGTFWFSDTPDQVSIGGPGWGNPSHRRICTWVQLSEIQSQKTFHVFNLHLEHASQGETARRKSVALLHERTRGKEPFVVTGDFNAKPDSAPIRYLLDHAYRDSWAGTHQGSTDPGYTYESWSGTTKHRIDYIFTNPDALLTNSIVFKGNITGSRGSDHYPVVSEFLLIVKD